MVKTQINKKEKTLLTILIFTLLILIYFLLFRKPIESKAKGINEEIIGLKDEVSILNSEFEDSIKNSKLIDFSDEELHRIVEENQSSFGDFYKIDSYIEEHYLIKLLEINMGAFSESSFSERELDSVKRTYKLKSTFLELVKLMEYISNNNEFIIGEYQFIKSDSGYILDLEVYSYGLTDIIRTGITYVSTLSTENSLESETPLEEKLNPKDENIVKVNNSYADEEVREEAQKSNNDINDFLANLQLEEKIMEKTLNKINTGSKTKINNLIGYSYFEGIDKGELKAKLDKYIVDKKEGYISNKSSKIVLSDIGKNLLIDKYYKSLMISIKTDGDTDRYYINYLENDMNERRVEIINSGNSWQNYEFFIDSNSSKYPIEIVSIESSNSDAVISIKDFYGISDED